MEARLGGSRERVRGSLDICQVGLCTALTSVVMLIHLGQGLGSRLHLPAKLVHSRVGVGLRGRVSRPVPLELPVCWQDLLRLVWFVPTCSTAVLALSWPGGQSVWVCFFIHSLHSTV